jgi:flagellar biosynthesis/type III secretory pathway chaperone
MQLQVDNSNVSSWKNQEPWTGSTDELGRLLEEEVSTLRELVEASLVERTALLAGDVEQLVVISQQKEELAKRMELLETRRQTILAASRDGHDSSEDDFSWDDWLKREPRERAAGLASARAEIARLVRRLVDIREGNRLLLESSLEQVQITLRFLLQIATSHYHYAQDGLPEVTESHLYKLVDCQV